VVAGVLGLRESAVKLGASFYNDLNMLYAGRHYRVGASDTGEPDPNQLSLVSVLPDDQEFTYPVRSPADITQFDSIIGGGELSSYVSLYAPTPAYVMASASDPATLEALVNQYLSQGFVLAGSAFTTTLSGDTDKICQPLMLNQT
jgi:hypothetical protein